jgi:hypothetical protein
MKNIIFCLLFILVFGCINKPLSAQGIISRGIKAGLNLSNISSKENLNTNSITGFSGGLFLTFDNVKSINTQLEFYFISKGYKYEGKTIGLKINETDRFFYIESAFVFYYSVNDIFRLLAGPYMAYFVSGQAHATIKGQVNGITLEREESSNIDTEYVNRFDYGILLGGSVQFYKQFKIELRYSMGLGNIPKGGTIKFKNTGFQILLEIPIVTKKS